ncbi:Suppressor STP22 of temperature-sensitive alpha-factor receptor and arginine permease [Gossypium arboreum]|uniref:Suppressor STP22 of temperature-sensitive alpha-factor receptor and arginine permease n=1 Tax=Gossypium arboreum TaxID=29729 RepID=A0A0B0NX60_GOSAR|nr:Suppressor STP22 of temperature-sensitive alpha-factor receptor and arginine permease [Gossypium arboreum]
MLGILDQVTSSGIVIKVYDTIDCFAMVMHRQNIPVNLIVKFG